MGDALHAQRVEPKPLDLFRARSDAFIFAALRDSGDLKYLPQGAAERGRTWAREHLMCPEPQCTSPEITTVSRAPGGRRDGYRHLVRPETAHEPTGLNHVQAQALIERWASRQPGVRSAAKEVRVGDGVRVADVLVTFEDESRLAIEVQYARESITDWEARCADYARLGIGVVWVWGHVGAQSPLVGRWRELALRLVRQGRPVLWINPSEEQVAWAYDVEGLLEPPGEPARPTYNYGSLDDLAIDPTGLYPPGFLWAHQAALDAAEEVRQHRAARKAWERDLVRKAEERQRAAQRRAAVQAEQASLFRVRNAPETGPWKFCRRCGRRLDEILYATGYHLLC